MGMQPCRGHDIMRRSSVTAPHTHAQSLLLHTAGVATDPLYNKTAAFGCARRSKASLHIIRTYKNHSHHTIEPQKSTFNPQSPTLKEQLVNFSQHVLPHRALPPHRHARLARRPRHRVKNDDNNGFTHRAGHPVFHHLAREENAHRGRQGGPQEGGPRCERQYSRPWPGRCWYVIEPCDPARSLWLIPHPARPAPTYTGMQQTLTAFVHSQGQGSCAKHDRGRGQGQGRGAQGPG